MKLTGRDAKSFLDKPSAEPAMILLFGADAVRVEEARNKLANYLVGTTASEELRLTRLTGADLRRDPAQLVDEIKATGFFPGHRAIIATEVTDGLTGLFSDALATWTKGDAQIIASAGALPARSKLRKLVEGSPIAVGIGVYDDPPDAMDIERMTQEAGLPGIDRGAIGALIEIGRAMGPADLRQTIEKLALYKTGSERPATADEVAILAPQMTEAGTDRLIAAIAQGDLTEIAPALSRLRAQGVTPTRLCIDATSHFKNLVRLAADPSGPSSAVTKLRPPVFGPRRDALIRQSRQWPAGKATTAIGLLLDTDLQLRSSSDAPQSALVERTFVRLARLARR